MSRARDLATVGALVGDPARAQILMMLMSGAALTATELAAAAGIAPSTASSHLAKLCDARLITVERQGRHRYFRLFDSSIADLVEQLAGITAEHAPRLRTGPSDPALRLARVCYDHLAGERGVWLLDQLRERRLLAGRDGLALSSEGEEFFVRFGIDLDALSRSRRPLCRSCLDWSERRSHLGGSLGAAVLARIVALRWVRRDAHSRALHFTSIGENAFSRLFQ